MDKPKLIVLESSDGLGKTTQAGRLSRLYNAKLVAQPSKENLVPKIREMALKDPDLSPLERQYLIAVSHTIDAFTEFDGTQNIIMDRSYISGLIYGHVSGLEMSRVRELYEILSPIYIKNLEGKYNVSIVFIDAEKRHNKPDMEDQFEKNNDWQKLRNEYLSNYNELIAEPNYHIFDKDEKVHLVDVTGKSVETVTELIREKIENGANT